MTCKHCNESQPVENMIVRHGKPVTCCQSCLSKKIAAGQKKGGKKRRSAEAQRDPETTLELAPTYATTATVEGEFLRLYQTDSEGTESTVFVSRDQLSQVIAKFQGWLNRAA